MYHYERRVLITAGICAALSYFASSSIVSLTIVVFLVLYSSPTMLKLFFNSRTARNDAINAIASINGYSSGFKAIVNRKKKLFFNLPYEQQQQGIPTYRRYKQAEYLATEKNSRFLYDLTQFFEKKCEISPAEVTLKRISSRAANPNSGINVLNAFVRDWSRYNTEREMLFEPFWKHLPPGCKLLIPGAGLGRFASDAVCRGFDVTAVEMDHLMSLSALYALSRPRNTTIFPFVHQFSHWYDGNDQLEGISLDFSSANVLKWLHMDFLDIVDTYDAVASLFFIDTAQNVFDYLKSIKRIVRPGGVWVNYGPLKWGTAPYCEPSADELIKFLSTDGWAIDAVWKGANRYDGSSSSMLASKYLLIGWRATRLSNA